MHIKDTTAHLLEWVKNLTESNADEDVEQQKLSFVQVEI